MKVRPFVCPLFLALALSCLLFTQVGAQTERFAVQLSASPDRAEAEAKLKEAHAQKLDAYLVKSNVANKGIFYRVRVGNYASRAAAEKAGQQFKASGAVSEYFVTDYVAPEIPAAPAPAIIAKATPTPAPARVAAANPAPVVITPKATPTPPATAAVKPTPPSVAANSGMPAVGNNAANVTKPAPLAAATSAAPAPATVTKPAGVASVLGGYSRFQDEGVGYSFEHPAYWVGGPLNGSEIQAQKNSGGAMFKSNEDQAFLNAIWNKLDKANSAEHDNDMIVDLILKSMATGSGTQKMDATNRTVINDGQQIKTFIDLKAAFVVPNQTSPLDFIGKGVIIRASKGILLVVTFYAKDAPQTVAMAADHIIKTAKTPE